MLIPRSEIKKFAVIDDNTVITFLVEELTKAETQGPTPGSPDAKLPAGCVMYKTTLRVTEPAKDADLLLYDNFVIGNAEDPDAAQPETWTSNKAFGARRLNEFLDAIGVVSEDSETWEEEAQEQQGQALVIVQTPTEGKYKGTPQNRIRAYYVIGQAPAQTPGKANSAGPKGQRAGAAAAKPPVPPQQAAKATPAAAKPVAARPGPKAVAKPPTTAAALATQAKPAAAVVTKGQQMLECAICNEPVARDEFQAHVQSCMEASANAPADE